MRKFKIVDTVKEKQPVEFKLIHAQHCSNEEWVTLHINNVPVIAFSNIGENAYLLPLADSECDVLRLAGFHVVNNSIAIK